MGLPITRSIIESYGADYGPPPAPSGVQPLSSRSPLTIAAQLNPHRAV
jgi:hypothetical protein